MDNNNINGDDIPDWLLTEVLVRLPSAKVVCRFKLVSKQWLSIISVPTFVRAYTSRASLFPQQQPWTFVYYFMHNKASHPRHRFPDQYLLRDIHSPLEVSKPFLPAIPIPTTHESNETFYIVAVSNGLVLYRPSTRSHSHSHFQFQSKYYIYNLVTGHWFALPQFTGTKFGSEICGFLTHDVEDGVLKTYRVVQLNVAELFITFYVFFSEIGEWKTFNISTMHKYVRPFSTTILNGILHWIANPHGYIIAYDPYHSPERMRIIEFPKDIQSQKHWRDYASLCAACRGHLTYFHMYWSWYKIQHFQLWVLSDYDSGDWCLQHQISFKDVLYNSGDWLLQHKSIYKDDFELLLHPMLPLCFHPFDSDVVYLGYKECLLTFNIKTKQLAMQEKLANERCSRGCVLWSSLFFLLVTPPWPLSCSLSPAADG